MAKPSCGQIRALSFGPGLFPDSLSSRAEVLVHLLVVRRAVVLSLLAKVLQSCVHRPNMSENSSLHLKAVQMVSSLFMAIEPKC